MFMSSASELIEESSSRQTTPSVLVAHIWLGYAPFLTAGAKLHCGKSRRSCAGRSYHGSVHMLKADKQRLVGFQCWSRAATDAASHMRHSVHTVPALTNSHNSRIHAWQHCARSRAADP